MENYDLTTLLESWSFSKYTEVFLENEVNIEALKLLDESQIRQLIPAVGPQAEFKKKLLEWKQAAEVAPETKTLEINEELDKIVDIYGQSIGGLTSGSPTGTPSSRSDLLSCSSLQNSDKQSVQDDSTTSNITRGKIAVKEQTSTFRRPNAENGKTLTKEIATEVLRKDPQLTVTADIQFLGCRNKLPATVIVY